MSKRRQRTLKIHPFIRFDRVRYRKGLEEGQYGTGKVVSDLGAGYVSVKWDKPKYPGLATVYASLLQRVR